MNKLDINNQYYKLNLRKDRSLQAYDMAIYSIQNKANTGIHWWDFYDKDKKYQAMGSHPLHYMEYQPNLLSFFPFNKKIID